MLLDITVTSNIVYPQPTSHLAFLRKPDYEDRIAAPYCPRAFRSRIVSTPLDWKEVKPGLRPESFILENISERLEEKGDLWAEILHAEKVASSAKVSNALY